MPGSTSPLPVGLQTSFGRRHFGPQHERFDLIRERGEGGQKRDTRQRRESETAFFLHGARACVRPQRFCCSRRLPDWRSSIASVAPAFLHI